MSTELKPTEWQYRRTTDYADRPSFLRNQDARRSFASDPFRAGGSMTAPIRWAAIFWTLGAMLAGVGFFAWVGWWWKS